MTSVISARFLVLGRTGSGASAQKACKDGLWLHVFLPGNVAPAGCTLFLQYWPSVNMRVRREWSRQKQGRCNSQEVEVEVTESKLPISGSDEPGMCKRNGDSIAPWVAPGPLEGQAMMAELTHVRKYIDSWCQGRVPINDGSAGGAGGVGWSNTGHGCHQFLWWSPKLPQPLPNRAKVYSSQCMTSPAMPLSRRRTPQPLLQIHYEIFIMQIPGGQDWGQCPWPHFDPFRLADTR